MEFLNKDYFGELLSKKDIPSQQTNCIQSSNGNLESQLQSQFKFEMYTEALEIKKMALKHDRYYRDHRYGYLEHLGYLEKPLVVLNTSPNIEINKEIDIVKTMSRLEKDSRFFEKDYDYESYLEEKRAKRLKRAAEKEILESEKLEEEYNNFIKKITKLKLIKNEFLKNIYNWMDYKSVEDPNIRAIYIKQALDYKKYYEKRI